MISIASPQPGNRSAAWPLLAKATLVALLLTAPAWILGPIFGDDFFYHLLYNTFFNEQLRAGDFYPRWLFNGNAGLGGPVFFFYGAVPSFATCFFSVFGLSVPHQMGAAVFVATLGSGVAAYVWAQMVVSRPAAVAAALLYMAHPYHLNVDLYLRFAFAEYWSFVWMPLVFAAMVAITRGRPHFWLLGAVSYALLIATHPPSVLIFTGLLVPYGLCLLVAAPGPQRLAIAARMAGSLVLGVALAGIYLVPALTTQQFASYAEVLKVWDARFFVDHAGLWRDGLLLSHVWRYGADPAMMVYANAVAFSLLVTMVCVGVACVRAESPRQRLWPLFWALIVALTMWSMGRDALPFWEFAHYLQRIQTPTRLNMAMVLALVPLVGYAVDRWPPGRALAVVAWVVVAVYAATFWVPSAKQIYWGWTKYAHVQTGSAILPPESRPVEVPRALASNAAMSALGEATPRAAFLSGLGTVSTPQWGPNGIVVETQNAQADALVVHQFNYPGWRVVSTPPSAFSVGATPQGLLSIQLPAGTYRLSITRSKLPAEWTGLAITASAVVVALGVLLVIRRRKRL
ncbi:hypothetical protein os1_19850 [Comamonadaceae bacterium OS-1]|nr:hypothetical protein os1_19850 [Comamonadaceae bacterium OS-1]